MLDTDLLPLPSLRPDGRLDRLNYGGGNNKQKMDRWVSDMGQFRKETGINPAAGKKSMARFDSWATEKYQGGAGGGGASVAASNAKPPQQVVSPEATAASATAAPMYTEKKKRRTLLSGQSINQENGTILGAV
jgi:hypothetical protein